ncbi:MAG: energy transducer TonB [Lewinella sp.]
MKTLFTLLALTLWGFVTADLTAQVATVYLPTSETTSEDPPARTVTKTAVNAAPRLMETELTLEAYIAERLRYPDLAVDYAVEGEVVISYTIQADGSMADIAVHQRLGYGCDEAALAIFEDMPRWRPAVRDGEAVAVKCYTPIMFHLQ